MLSTSFLKSIKFSAVLILFAANISLAADLNIPNTPLFSNQSVAPVTMLVMGRDHKLYYEAYNNASDLNGDGTLDLIYNPEVDYYGYFDSYKCYRYNYNGSYFYPYSKTPDKRCNNMWSGDFLNYLTTSRMDAMRKVLYGGYRSTDTNSTTILERSHIPQDAHTWGTEYTRANIDDYNISHYAPLTQPRASRGHLFANTTLLFDSRGPLLRVAPNMSYRIWDWISIADPVAGSRVLDGQKGPNISNSITDYVVRVKVCDASVGLEDNCQRYPNGNAKPVGLLQELGENDKMKFGLLTGSYSKNLSGGVLRKNISSFSDEVDLNTGIFTSTVGITKTIDRLRTIGFGDPDRTMYGSHNYYYQSCGWIRNRDMRTGECRMWGNPIGEMIYETLRYFSGKTSPTSAYNYSGGDDDILGLPQPNWENPYASDNNPWCAKPNMVIISDIYPTYDSDEIPGSTFNSFSGDLSPALNVASLGQTIWNNEHSGTRQHFIGQSGANYDGSPTAKDVSSFGNIRGLAPAETNTHGSYYSAGAAYYGWLNDINTIKNEQRINSYVVALASPLPEININVGNHIIKVIPFAKTVGPVDKNWYNPPEPGLFHPTGPIVDIFPQSITPTSGLFRVNFENSQQGANFDMDALVEYHYQVNSNNTVTITLTSKDAHTFIQHIGYVISGTTADGAYLEVRDTGTDSDEDVDFFLDTPPGQAPGGNWRDRRALPLTASRTFTPGSNQASLLKGPLWYTAKYGGFIDKNDNDLPDLVAEYDADTDSVPDNYFLVTNPIKLKQQLSQAMTKIMERSGSTTPASLNTGILKTGSKLYQAKYDSGNWSGQVLAYSINSDGSVSASGTGAQGSLWDAGKLLTNKNYDTGREIITYKPSSSTGIAFRWPNNTRNPRITELDSAQISKLEINPTSGAVDNLGEARLNYIRGSKTDEQLNGGTFRDRTGILGDVIHSAPHFVSAPSYQYANEWPTGAAENAISYTNFKSTYANRAKMLYFGANDGMLHALNADTGVEEFAYVPGALFSHLNKLTDPNYSHYFFADGSVNTMDVLFDGAWHTVLVGGLNRGGQAIYALDITDPSKFTETNADKIVLWEFSDADDADLGDLGFTYSQPAIARMANGKWAAVFGNGYNNTAGDGNASRTGNAVLYIVDIATGDLIKKFDTGVGSSAHSSGLPNGLATPVLVDINGDSVADFVYVGDLLGNLWKIDIQNTDPDKWDFAYQNSVTVGSSGDDDDDDDDDDNSYTMRTPRPFFIARDANGNRQAITSRPIAAKYKGTTLVVAFGTGKFLEPSDRTDNSVQSFYALFDAHTTPVSGRAQLLQQTITDQISNNGFNYRITSNNALSNTDRGWYLDIVYNNNLTGERVIAEPMIRNGKVIFTTMQPVSDPCGWGGTGWLMEMDAFSGSRLTYSPFDVNADGGFGAGDHLTTSNNNSVPVSGMQSTVGIISTPAIMATPDKEFLYFTGSSGEIQMVVGNPGSYAIGRQSWRQLK